MNIVLIYPTIFFDKQRCVAKKSHSAGEKQQENNMRKVHFLMGLALLFGATSLAVGQDYGACNPCEAISNPCDPICGPSGSLFTFGGWIDMGVYANSHGFNNNGPMYTGSKRRTDFVMNQLYLTTEKKLDARRGWDWGARADLVYGAHAGSMQTYDGTFDSDRGLNRHGYSMSAYKLYGELGYQNLSVRAGKFGTPIGWESSASKDNFFYSHSYCYWIEPATHMGVLATYEMTDRFSFSAGWVTGEDSSFKNPYNNKGVLTGFEYALADDATIYYWMSAGKGRNGYYEFDTADSDYFMQSLCFEWALTERFTYVFQYNLRNDNEIGGDRVRRSTYGINNHFLYKLNDQWGAGLRFEWLRDGGGYISDTGEGTGNYYQITLGLNWNPYKNVSIRPEVRYDWANGGATPFGPASTFGDYPDAGTRSDQVSGGVGVVVSF
jgi:hypothetical protein